MRMGKFYPNGDGSEAAFHTEKFLRGMEKGKYDKQWHA
jgi:hypothetical protein